MSSDFVLPQTRYASVGNDRVAYQVFGKGKRDLVHVTGLWSHVDVAWDEPSVARFLRRLGSFSRLIRFDRRGSGLSDPRPEDGRSEAEHWQEDLLAVLDTVKSEAPYLLCQLDGGPLALLFVDAHPKRCSGLILVNTTARYLEAPDYPQGHRPKDAEKFVEFVRKNWGNERFCEILVPSQAQTVHDLLARGYAVQLPRDAVSARFPLEDGAGWAKMTSSGAVPTSTEGVLFEWLGDAKHSEFKTLHKLVV